MPKPLGAAALWSLIIFVAILFFIAGLAQLVGGQSVINQFADWGYPPWFPTFVGILEILGAACLLYPPIATIASAALGGLMLGAIATHLKVGEAVQALGPMAFLAATIAVGYFRRTEACWIKRAHQHRHASPTSPATA